MTNAQPLIDNGTIPWSPQDALPLALVVPRTVIELEYEAHNFDTAKTRAAALLANKAIDAFPALRDVVKYYHAACSLQTERPIMALAELRALSNKPASAFKDGTDLQRLLTQVEAQLRAQGLPTDPPQPLGIPGAASSSTGETTDEWSQLLPDDSQIIQPLAVLAARAVARVVSQHPEDYYNDLGDIPEHPRSQIFSFISFRAFHVFKKHPLYARYLHNTSLYAAIRAEENFYRSLFVKSRSHPELADPYVTLIDVWEEQDAFITEPLSPEEAKWPMLFDHTVPQASGVQTVVSQPMFKTHWDIFTEGQLAELNWDNVFVAGGCVLAALTPAPEGSKRDYFHNVAYPSSDIDLFIYGLTPEQANDKLLEIEATLKVFHDKHGISAVESVRTRHAITFISQYPFRNIQVILRCYKSPAEVLLGFDIDCCAVGYDGSTVWAAPRAARALKMRYNLFDLDRRSKTYEARLIKYGKRGYAIALPKLDISRIQNAFKPERARTWMPPVHGEGLATLLRGNQFFFSNMPPNPAEIQPAPRFWAKRPEFKIGYPGDNTDYSNIHIAYGEHWTHTAVMSRLRNLVTNSEWVRSTQNPPQALSTHLVIGDINVLLQAYVSTGVPSGIMEADPDNEDAPLATMIHVDGIDMWRTVNPGGQDDGNPYVNARAQADGSLLMTGSFSTPSLTEEQWYATGYEPLPAAATDGDTTLTADVDEAPAAFAF